MKVEKTNGFKKMLSDYDYILVSLAGAIILSGAGLIFVNFLSQTARSF